MNHTLRNNSQYYDFVNDTIEGHPFTDLSECVPFIDYVQLYCDCIPIDWIYSLDNLKEGGLSIPGFENPKAYELWVEFNPRNCHYQIKTNTNFRIHLMPVTIGRDTSNPVTRWEGKIYIPSSPLPHDLNDAIRYIYKTVTGIKSNLNLEGNNKTWLYAKDWKISKMDLSLNIVSPINLDELEFYKKNKPNLHRWYVQPVIGKLNGIGQDVSPYLTSGLALGNRGSKSLQLMMYYKSKDPKPDSFIKKYGKSRLAETVRLEYKVPRTILTALKNPENDTYFGLNTLEDLSWGHVIAAWNYCVSNRGPKIDNLVRPENVSLMPPAYKTNHEHRYRMIVGMISKYKDEEVVNHIFDLLNILFSNQGINPISKEEFWNKYINKWDRNVSPDTVTETGQSGKKTWGISQAIQPVHT